jgi:transcriptional regulator with XRE-family HTH domain
MAISSRPFNGERLRARRLALGWRKEDLAARAQVSYPALVSYESGRQVPKPSTIAVLARALRVSPAYFEQPTRVKQLVS